MHGHSHDPPPSHRRKQTIEHIENYITPALWHDMRRGDDHRHVLVDVAKLIVALGIMFPSEKLLGQIVALIGFCHCGPLPPTMQLLNEVKETYRACREDHCRAYRGEYRSYRGYRRQDIGPPVYPQFPSELLTSHPHLLPRAYPCLLYTSDAADE